MTCPHGMPTPATCYDCMIDGPVAPPETTSTPKAVTRSFPARYDGTCPVCEFPISTGECIVRMSDDSYRHEGCA